MRLHDGWFVGALLSLPLAASAQVLPLPLLGEASVPLPSLSETQAPLTLGLAPETLPEPPAALSVEPLFAAEKESSDPNAFKSSAAELAQTLDRIRQDGWNGKGPGNYKLAAVTHIYLDRSGGLPTLYVNAQPVGYMRGGSHAAAAAMKDALRAGGHSPRSVVIEGQYADTVFYIDRIRFGD